MLLVLVRGILLPFRGLVVLNGGTNGQKKSVQSLSKKNNVCQVKEILLTQR